MKLDADKEFERQAQLQQDQWEESRRRIRNEDPLEFYFSAPARPIVSPNSQSSAQEEFKWGDLKVPSAVLLVGASLVAAIYNSHFSDVAEAKEGLVEGNLAALSGDISGREWRSGTLVPLILREIFLAGGANTESSKKIDAKPVQENTGQQEILFKALSRITGSTKYEQHVTHSVYLKVGDLGNPYIRDWKWPGGFPVPDSLIAPLDGRVGFVGIGVNSPSGYIPERTEAAINRLFVLAALREDLKSFGDRDLLPTLRVVAGNDPFPEVRVEALKTIQELETR